MGSDWHTLLEFCALVNSLIIDEDGIYDPRLINENGVPKSGNSIFSCHLQTIDVMSVFQAPAAAALAGGHARRFHRIPLRKP
jgi:hypothetical protein